MADEISAMLKIYYSIPQTIDNQDLISHTIEKSEYTDKNNKLIKTHHNAMFDELIKHYKLVKISTVIPQTSTSAEPLDVIIEPGTVPIRCVSVRNSKLNIEHESPTSYSPMYQQFSQRLTDTVQTGTLGSIVRGETIRDGSSVMSLSKIVSSDPGSTWEIASTLKLLCMGCSIDKTTYRMDPTTYKFCRRAKDQIYTKSNAITNLHFFLNG